MLKEGRNGSDDPFRPDIGRFVDPDNSVLDKTLLTIQSARPIVSSTLLMCVAAASLAAEVVFPYEAPPVLPGHTFARLAGSGNDVITAVKAAPSGDVVVAGNTISVDFPVKAAAQPASAESPAMRTTDGGRTWTRFTPPPTANSTGPQYEQLTTFTAPPNIAGVLFAAVGASLWRSSDAGQSWQSVYTAPPAGSSSNGFIVAIGFDQLAPGTVYLGGSDGFSISQDLGNTWHKQTSNHAIGAYYGSVYGLSQPRIENDPRGSGALIANTSARYPSLSRDAGKTWTLLRPTSAQTSSVATFSRTQPGRIYVGVSAGASGSMWVTDDWGQTWSLTKAQPPNGVIDLLTEPDQPNVLYVITRGGLAHQR